MKTKANVCSDSGSDDEHSEIGLQDLSGSSEGDGGSESENDVRDRSTQKTSKKRKFVKLKISDSESSSEDEITSSVVRTSKKRRKESTCKTSDFSEIKESLDLCSSDETAERIMPVKGSNKKSDVSSGDETEERVMSVKGNSKTSDVSSGDETEERNETPIKEKKKTSDIGSDDEVEERDETSMKESSSGSDSDEDSCFSPKQNKSFSSGKGNENGDEMQKNMQEQDTSDSEEESGNAENSTKESNNGQKLAEKTRKPSSDSSDDSIITDEKSKSVFQKKSLQSDSSDSVESSISLDMPKTTKNGKKKKSDGNKVENEVRKKVSGNAETTDPKIERLKKYLRVAGLHVRSYQKLWEGCKSKKAKAEKLLQMLSDAGLKGKPTLQKCKKLKAKRERKEEIESLDVGNIISSDMGRPKRNSRSLYLNPHTSAAGKKPLEEKNVNIFSRIKSFVDSEGSD